MLELAPGDPIVKAYLTDLQHLKDQQVTHELGLKAPFHTLLDKAAKKRGWTLVAELSTYSGSLPNSSAPPRTCLSEESPACGGDWKSKGIGPGGLRYDKRTWTNQDRRPGRATTARR